MAREFLMLAHVYDSQSVGGWFCSEKLDGMRCFWDGGVSTGLAASNVPWANTAKHGRYTSTIYSTGLWSRYGQPIQAPKWFIDSLPKIPLDGELWMGRNSFQKTMSTVKDLVPGPAWNNVQYKVFDAPSYLQVFSNGEIKLKKRYEKVFSGIMEWLKNKLCHPDFLNLSRRFMDIQELLKDYLVGRSVVSLHKQEQLPLKDWKPVLEEQVTKVLEKGGEGVMLRNPTSLWAPSRCHSLLKYKPTQDAEGVVVGFTWGRETDLGSKLLGKMGALIVEWKRKRFKLSGFTDEERHVTTKLPMDAIALFQGMEGSWDFSQPTHFPKGSTVTFTYRELSDDGIPKEARYLRMRPDE